MGYVGDSEVDIIMWGGWALHGIYEQARGCEVNCVKRVQCTG